MNISQLWSLNWVRAVQSLGPLMLAPMTFLSFIGEGFLFLMAPLLFWSVHKAVGRELTILLLLSSSVNLIIKALIKEPRPYWLDPALALSHPTGFSFPSGHSQASTVAFGALVYVVLRTGWPALRRGTVALILALLVLLVMLSRVYLGAHYPGDTLAGMLTGLVVLALFLGLRPILKPILAGLPLGAHAALAVLACLLVLGLASLALSAGIQVRAAAPALVEEGRAAALAEATMFAGLLPGMWIGFAWERGYVGFSVDGAWWQRGLRFAFGVLIAAGLYLAIHALIAALPGSVAVPLTILMFALLAFWVAALWPWLFVRMGLAERQTLTS
jgi:membrane-associated phospholipid phosphatase